MLLHPIRLVIPSCHTHQVQVKQNTYYFDNITSLTELVASMMARQQYGCITTGTIRVLMQVTLLHLHTVKQFLTESQVQHAVDVMEARVLSLYEKLTIGQWRNVRQTLCRFFQDRRIKVPATLHMRNVIRVCNFAWHAGRSAMGLAAIVLGCQSALTQCCVN